MRSNRWKGAAAGLAGGLVASFVMNRFQALWTKLVSGEERSRRHSEQGGQVKKSEMHRRPEREEPDTATARVAARLSQALLGRELDREEKKSLGAVLHYGFGAGVGAAYGAAAEGESFISAGAGLPFGAAVWLAADEIAVPALKLSKSPAEYPASVHLQSLFTHFVYGATTELVRRLLRKAL